MERVKERDIEMEKLQTDYTWTECLTNQSEQMMTGFSFLSKPKSGPFMTRKVMH